MELVYNGWMELVNRHSLQPSDFFLWVVVYSDDKSKLWDFFSKGFGACGLL